VNTMSDRSRTFTISVVLYMNVSYTSEGFLSLLDPCIVGAPNSHI